MRNIKMAKATVLFLLLTAMAINIYSLNANGLRQFDKIKKLFSVLNEWKCDFCLLQETFWDEALIDDIKPLWNGKIMYSNSDNNRSGVAILVHKKWVDCTKLLHTDESGRIISIEVNIEKIQFNLMSIYAPNICKQRELFFNSILNLTSRNTIVGGDFNTSLSQKDRHNTTHVFDRSYYALHELLARNDLIDLWRSRNRDSNTFSWKRVINGTLKMSRIDFYLVPNSIKSYVRHIFYKHTLISDHDYIYMQLDFSQVERGPGVWVFNNQFLLEDRFCNIITDLVRRETEDMLYDHDRLVWWDNVKFKIKKLCQKYGQERSKAKYNKYNTVQRKLNKLNEDLSAGKEFNLMEYENLKHELAVIENEMCQGAILRSKAKWAVEGDKNTKYFLNLEKSRRKSNAVTEILNEDGDVVKDTLGILNEEYKFYSHMYSCVKTDTRDIDHFLKDIPVKVTPRQQADCDKNITRDEIFEALSGMSKNKTPGSDGLTTEFYLHFWDIFCDIFLNIFKTIKEENIMARSMRHGHISLIYKKGDKRLLKNYRPISLLNVDYKILARVLSNRLKHILPNIISFEQTSCIPGRDISDTVASIRDIIDVADKEKLEAYLIKIDQEKAFDRVDHTYLNKIISKLGFGQHFCDWISIFYRNIFSAVKCNGFVSKYFPVKNSVRQGCPISALLFVITAEPLNYVIRNSKSIQGVIIPNSNYYSLIYQHADDTTLTVSNKKSVTEVFEVFEKYGKASGAKVNKTKSEIMNLGSGCFTDGELENIGINKCEETTQILGVYLGSNQKACEEKNWREKVNKILNILNMWKLRYLNIQGRSTVISTLLLSRLWYISMVLPIPEWVVSEVKRACLQFLWLKKAYSIKYVTIIGTKSEGGLNIPDMEAKSKAFRLKFLARYINNDYHAIWKETFKYYCRLAFIANFKDEFLYLFPNASQLSVLPKIYQEMFLAWREIQSNVEKHFEFDDILKQPLFFNPRINYNNKVLNFECFSRAGIHQMRDIMYEVIPGFLRVAAIKEIILQHNPDISEKIIEKSYMIIKNSIPLEWFTNIISRKMSKVEKTTNNEFTVLGCGKMYLLSQCKTSIFYRILRENMFQLPTSQIMWESKFDNLEFQKLASLIHCGSKCPDMVELDFKIYHNIVYTYEKLFKIGYVNSSLCPMCRNGIENVYHMFYSCDRLRIFLQHITYHLETLFQNMDNDVVNSLQIEQLMLFGYKGNHKRVNRVFVNFFLSQARQCIYRRRMFSLQHDRHIDIITYFKYSLQKNIEYIFEYYMINKKINSFENKFLRYNFVLKLENDKLSFCW